MAKWADYLISAVRFNAAETHIDKVRVHPDNDASVGIGNDMSRTEVIRRIDGGATFATIYKNAEGEWSLGARVGVVLIDGVKYIRTRADRIKADNLDDLPRY